VGTHTLNVLFSVSSSMLIPEEEGANDILVVFPPLPPPSLSFVSSSPVLYIVASLVSAVIEGGVRGATSKRMKIRKVEKVAIEA
jgi:hypothetical protein